MITTSWNHEDLSPEDNMEDAELFSLVIRAKVNTSVKQLIWIDSRYITREAYGVDGEDLDVELRFYDPIRMPTITPKLLQNYPNPFSEITKIGFELPSAGETNFQIRDGAGKVYRIIKGEYPAGYNEIVLERGNLPAGLLYYTIETDEYTATRKMILIK
jgi:hypothetical protein